MDKNAKKLKMEKYNWICAWCGSEIDLSIMDAPAITLTEGPDAVINHTSGWRIIYLFFGEKEIPFFIRPVDLKEDFDIITVLCSEECKKSVNAILDKIMVAWNSN